MQLTHFVFYADKSFSCPLNKNKEIRAQLLLKINCTLGEKLRVEQKKRKEIIPHYSIKIFTHKFNKILNNKLFSKNSVFFNYEFYYYLVQLYVD